MKLFILFHVNTPDFFIKDESEFFGNPTLIKGVFFNRKKAENLLDELSNEEEIKKIFKIPLDNHFERNLDICRSIFRSEFEIIEVMVDGIELKPKKKAVFEKKYDRDPTCKFERIK